MDNRPDQHEYCTGGYMPDDIVISGMAGRFPLCENIAQLAVALYSKTRLIQYSDERFEKGACNMPFSSCGLINNIDKLDAEFFCMAPKAVSGMDPAARKAMEVSYEAIVDSGYDPYHLRGTNIGVYNATTSGDAHQMAIDGDIPDLQTYLRCITSNRTSYALDVHGPSLMVDTGCSSSAVALWTAVNDLRENRIDAAVINACQLNLDPRLHAAYVSQTVQTKTGNNIPFDERTDGILRSEAAVALFIQKASDARRCYATIASIKFMGSGFVFEGLSVPSVPFQIKVSEAALEEAGITADDVDFIEAHGTGTLVGDPIEVNALCQAYCQNRKRPLYVGSVKDSMGHSECASGSCGIVKVLLAFETGLFSPSVRYKNANPACTAIVEGKIQVVTENMPLTTPYISVNSFGFGGTLVQMVLKRNHIVYSKKETVKKALPKLILYPATTHEAVAHVFDFIRRSPDLRQEFFALMHKLSFTPTSLKPCRGYGLFKEGSESAIQIQDAPSKRPVWFVFTGMGCQWSKMGLQLMEIKAFADSMNASAATLKTVGCDLFAILSEKKYLEAQRQITPAFVGISSIQIALVDVLRSLGITPDGIVGHSTGELVAAYADGCCTAEQTVLSAYLRGKATEGADLPQGAMAALGLSWDEVEKRCPEGVYAACDNSDDSVTISGLKENVEKFVEQLKSENVFARVVDAYGYSFHSTYIAPAAKILKDSLLKLFKNPKPRSSKWISSSYSESDWNSQDCKMAGAEYFTHNLLGKVQFREATKKIPSDAIAIEIGPHFLMLSILKRSVGPDASYIGLMKRNDENSVDFFLEAVGKMYIEGLDPKVDRLYPPVKFPVPRTTPVISNLLKWNYSQSFFVPKWTPQSGELLYEYKLEKKDSYLMDHHIDGRSLFPATGYIVMAWRCLATKLQKKFIEMPIHLKNFKIHKATIISNQPSVKFFVNLLGNSGVFEVTESKSLVASGEIYEWKTPTFSEPSPTYHCDSSSSILGADLYNELKMSGYQYGPAFQGLTEIDMDGTQGLVSWEDRWIPFLDSLLLFFGLVENSSEFVLPTGALSFKVDPNALSEHVENASETQKGVPVAYNKKTLTVRSVGVEITNLSMDVAPRRTNENHPTLEQYKYVPYVYTFTPEKEASQYLSNYMSACNTELDKIGKLLGLVVKDFKFPVNSNDVTSSDEFSPDLAEEQQLLTILKQIADNPSCAKRGRKELFTSYLNNIGQDVLNCMAMQDYTLRILTEIISENSFRKLNVLEINRGMTAALPALTAIVKKFSYIKFKSSSYISPPDYELSRDVLEECNIQQYSLDMLTPLTKEKNQDLAISSFLWGTRDDLYELVNTLSKTVKEKGFVLFFFKERINPAEKFLYSLFNEEPKMYSCELLEKLLKEKNFTILSKLSDRLGSSVYLLRSSLTPAPSTILKISETDTFNWVDQVKVFLSKNSSDTLWLISEQDVASGIVGMTNCLKQEPGGERIRCVFMPKKTKELPSFGFEHSCYKQILEKDLIMNVWKDGSWGSFRHVLIKNSNPLRTVEHSYVNCRKYGDLSSFEWLESHVKYAQVTDEKLVHIYYSALNFKDVMLASGKLSVGTSKIGDTQIDDSVLGLEFSGRDTTGKRVAGFIKSRGMATSTLVDPNMCIDVPDKWTLEQAATVPIVYATCYYALAMRARLRREESILIHSGTGGIGLAAIHIALSMNCEIFTTVGNEKKRKYLREKFPQIKNENIGCSRDTTFEKMVMERTSGKGVNVVLNSLADDKFSASVRCVATNGRYVEIGKYDLALDRKIGLKIFLQNITFHGVFLDQLFVKTAEAKATLIELMQLVKEGITHGVVKPLDTKIFSRKEVEEAFRYMSKGIHVGKVLIKIRDEEKDKRAIPQTLAIPAVPKTYFYANKSYIVIGGLGGFGIEVTKWILSRGGKNVFLTSRYGARTPYHYLCLRRWNKAGYNVQVSTLNVAKASEAEKLLREATHVAPVGGIFNSAVVLKDAFMDCQTAETYEEVCAPKAAATKHLDEFSRRLCPALDYFVCFSSVSCGRGNAGQTNYGYANSVMERVCEDRRSQQLHGVAVQWGIIGEVGVVHRHMGDDAMIAGVTAQSVKSCLEALDSFCQIKFPVVSSYVNAASFKKLNQVDVLTQVSKVLGMQSLAEISETRSFGEMGIDSLVGVEIKQLLENNCDVSLTLQEIFDLKVGDVRALVEKAESDNTSKVTQLVSTASISLPPCIINEKPVVALNNQTKGAPVFFVKMGDDDLSDFKTLGEAFNQPVFALLWTKDCPTSDMKALATWYLRLIENQTHTPFHLVGYSLGGSLAFEMALQCEKSKKSIKALSLLSGSSDLRKTLSKESEPKNAEVKSVMGFIEQFVPDGVPNLEDQLTKANTLDQRIGIVLNFLTKSSSQTLNKNEISAAITSFVQKSAIIRSYLPDGKLSGDISLIEDATQVLANDITEIKQLFAQICNGKVNIHRTFSASGLGNSDDMKKIADLLTNVL